MLRLLIDLWCALRCCPTLVLRRSRGGSWRCPWCGCATIVSWCIPLSCSPGALIRIYLVATRGGVRLCGRCAPVVAGILSWCRPTHWWLSHLCRRFEWALTEARSATHWWRCWCTLKCALRLPGEALSLWCAKATLSSALKIVGRRKSRLSALETCLGRTAETTLWSAKSTLGLLEWLRSALP